jgi:S1-C subfamily serine protease/thiol-disulfide isomerase/thioredoxin/phage FluMu protein Com
MGISVKCGKCQSVLLAPDDKAGQRAKCPKCGTVLQISPLAAVASQKQATPRPAKPNGSNADFGLRPVAGDVNLQPLGPPPATIPSSSWGSSKPAGWYSGNPQKSGGGQTWLWMVGVGAAILALIVIAQIAVQAYLRSGTEAPNPQVVAVAPTAITAPEKAPPEKTPPEKSVTSATPVTSPSPSTSTPKPSAPLPSGPLKAAPMKSVPVRTSKPVQAAPPPPTATKSPSDGAAKSVADVIDSVRDGIVLITVMDADGKELGLGTGFVIEASGLVATNFHVMGNSHKAKAQFRDGTVFDILGFNAYDPARDLAIVQLSGRPPNMSVLKLRPDGLPRQGSDVIAFGHPRGFKFSTTTGIVSAVHTTAELPKDVQDFLRSPDDQTWIQTNAAISGGNSGGPLLNMQGEVLGINTWVANGQNLGFACHVKHLATLMTQLKPKSVELAKGSEEAMKPKKYEPSDPQIVRLMEELKTAAKAFMEELKQAERKGGTQQFVQVAVIKNPIPVFVQRFQAIADENRKKPVALEALVSVCELLNLEGQFSEPDFRRAADRILEDHIDDANLGLIIFELGHDAKNAVLSWLRQLCEQAKEPKVCGPACYTLAYALSQIETKSSKHEAEITTLLQRVTKEFHDMPYGEDTLRHKAEQLLFEVQYLAIGKQAPEVVGREVTGKELKLSEFRGRVVVIDFFADWCPACSAMYPEERSMVEKYKDKPFALLGVNIDRKERFQQVVNLKKVTWRCWWDGPNGSISTCWNVSAYPTMYVLDEQGIVRHKFVGAPGSKLTEAIDELLSVTKGKLLGGKVVKDDDLDAQLDNLAANVNIQPYDKLVAAASVLMAEQRDQMTKEHLALVEGWIQKGLETDPTAFSLQMGIAQIRQLEGKVSEAEKVLRDLVKVEHMSDVQVSAAKSELAYLLVAQSDPSAKEGAEALELIQDAIRRMDQNSVFLETRALAYLALKKMPQARADMATSIAAHPTPIAYYHLALIEHSTKNTDGATGVLKRALGLGLTKAQLCPCEQRQLEKLAKSLKVALPKDVSSPRKGTAASNSTVD